MDDRGPRWSLWSHGSGASLTAAVDEQRGSSDVHSSPSAAGQVALCREVETSEQAPPVVEPSVSRSAEPIAAQAPKPTEPFKPAPLIAPDAWETYVAEGAGGGVRASHCSPCSRSRPPSRRRLSPCTGRWASRQSYFKSSRCSALRGVTGLDVRSPSSPPPRTCAPGERRTYE